MSEKINVLIGANIEGLKSALAESGRSLEDFGTIAENAPKRAKTAVDQLNQSYRDAVKDAKNLALMQGQTSEAFYEAQLKARNLKNEIEGLNQVVTKNAIGGQDIEATSRKFDMLGHSVNQITRELPAFTHSMSTGFMAVSNNIPMLVDQIRDIKLANAELIKQGQPVQSVFTQLATSIFSWQTALSLGITLLTVYGEKIYNYIAGIKQTSEELKKAAAAQEELNDLRDKYLLTEEELALRNENIEYDKLVASLNAEVSAYEGMQDVQNLTLANAKAYRDTKIRINNELEIAEKNHLQKIADIRKSFAEKQKKEDIWEYEWTYKKYQKMIDALAEFKDFYIKLTTGHLPKTTDMDVPEGLEEKEPYPLFPSEDAMILRAEQHNQFLAQMEKRAMEHANRMKAINSILASSFAMIGQAIGDAFATGDFGGGALKLLAQFMALVGNAAIAVGMAYAAMGFTAGQGAIAIGAGIALIAASRVVASKAGGGSTGNTSTSNSSSGGQSGGGSVPSFNPTGMMVSIDGLVRGNNIVVALDNQTRMNKRVR